MFEPTPEADVDGRKDEIPADVATLHSQLSHPPSKYHKKELALEEQELLEHHKYWAHYCNHEFVKNPQKGKESYDLDEVMYFDLMGFTPRGAFDAHFDKIGPYFASANISYKYLEVVAVTKDFGYSTMIQHYWGTSSDGHAFDFTYRITALLRKIDGKWKWIHEHLSFPVDIASRKADFSSSLDAMESLYVEGQP